MALFPAGIPLSKRLFDLLASASGLLILSPILIVLALFVRFKLGSPVLFKQLRPGLKSRPFWIYKFRSMADLRDEQGELLPDQARTLRLGRVLALHQPG